MEVFISFVFIELAMQTTPSLQDIVKHRREKFVRELAFETRIHYWTSVEQKVLKETV